MSKAAPQASHAQSATSNSSIQPFLRPVIGAGAATGALGLVGGGVYGLLKSPRPGAFTAAVTLQSTYYGSSIMLARQAILFGFSQEDANKRSVKTFASGTAGAFSGMLASTWQHSTAPRTAILIGTLAVLSQIGYDSLYASYSKTRDTTPILERMANSPWMPIKSLADDEYEDILRGRIEKLEAEISSVESQIGSLQRQKQVVSSKDP